GPHLVPRGAGLVGVRLRVGAARVGEAEGLTALALLRDDQPFVGELLQRRVDGSGAGLPAALAALGDLLDDLVAVARLLRQQREDRGAHVAALGLAAPAAPAAVAAERAAGTPRAAAEVERERSRAAASPVPVLVVVVPGVALPELPGHGLGRVAEGALERVHLGPGAAHGECGCRVLILLIVLRFFIDISTLNR